MTTPRFFVPGTDDETHATRRWEAVRSFAEAQTTWTVSGRKIFQVNYHHNGKPLVAEVGEPDPLTGEVVQVILESTEAFLICTANHGVERGVPLLVGPGQIRTVEGFEVGPELGLD